MERIPLKNRLYEALTLREKKAIDLSNDLEIPKSAISQYLSGNRTIKDSKRIYKIAKYLNVSEAWLMGFDVPIEREEELQKENDVIADIIVRLRTDEDFRNLVIELNKLDKDKTKSIKQMLAAFLK